MQTVQEKPRTKNVLPEFELYQPQEGHPFWPQLAEEAKTMSSELLKTLAKPEKGLSEISRKTASYYTLFKNYWVNRKLAKQGREDLRPLYFIWTMLRTCNFRCSYCDDHQGKKYPDLNNNGVLNTENAFKILEVMRTRASSVYFAGGEPTIRQDLPEITQRAKELNYYPIIINTNGSLIGRWLKKANWKNWLANMDIVIVSLDALDLGLLNNMWEYRKSHEVIRNLLVLRELAQEMNFKLMVNTVIQPDRIKEARAVLDFANDMDIWFTSVPMNVGPTIERSLLDNVEYLDLVETILERKRQGYKITGSLRMNQRLLYAEKFNCRNTIKPHIDYDGKLIWPCKASINVSPESINTLDYDHVDTLYQEASEKIDPTGFHGSAPNQCGANCNWAQNYSTDCYYQGLLNPMSLIKDIGMFLKG